MMDVVGKDFFRRWTECMWLLNNLVLEATPGHVEIDITLSSPHSACFDVLQRIKASPSNKDWVGHFAIPFSLDEIEVCGVKTKFVRVR